MFVFDPCGIVCIFVTYSAVTYADYVVIRWIVIQQMTNSLWGAFHVIIFNSLILLLVCSHLRAVLSDPGLIPLPQTRLDFSDLHSGQLDNEDDWTVCSRCETYRPPRAHHCRICKRCIRRMDHHCPWINNCVGEQNQKFFLQFLVYVSFLSLYAILLIISSLWLRQDPSEDVITQQTRMLHLIVLLLESALFGMFVCAILCDQLQAIFGDETAVEQAGAYRGKLRRRPASKMMLLSEVCGKTHPLMWLVPFVGSSKKRYMDTPLLLHDV